jgi:glycosyltransferase involved in cell wall biosynthesis
MRISIVVPVYGCDASLALLAHKVHHEMAAIGCLYEVILVDDGAPPMTWRIIQRLSREDNRLRGVRLSRNFGQHAAIMAGIRSSRGDLIIVMDCDLQDSVADIPRFIEQLEHSEIVVGVRSDYGASRMREFQGRIYAWVVRVLTGHRIDPRVGGMVSLRRNVADVYSQFTEPDQHFLYILDWIGFSKSQLPVKRDDRQAGTSAYRFSDRIRHAARGILFFPARIVWLLIFVGLGMLSVGSLALLVVLVQNWRDVAVPGWFSTISVLGVLSGMNLALTSLVGLYTTKVYELAKRRPNYVVSDETGLSPN